MNNTEDIKNKLIKLHEDSYKIEVEVLENGKLPVKAHFSDAGFDVFATSDIRVFPGQVIKHPLNIKCNFPSNCWAEITTKSGLGSQGILVYAGVIDSGYRGIPHVVLTNIKYKNQLGMNNLDPIDIKKGEKLAQIIMSPYSELFYMKQVDHVESSSERGEGGFGSSGS